LLLLILKRLEIVLGSAPATVRLSSSNPAYPPYERPIEDLRVQGRVMGKWVWK
jgi:SOS-response transcriptional repressor LexA